MRRDYRRTSVINTDGYRRDSPNRGNPFNVIPSGNITMKGVDEPIRAIPVVEGRPMESVVMRPGQDYKFPGAQYVIESKVGETQVPKMQYGGEWGQDEYSGVKPGNKWNYNLLSAQEEVNKKWQEKAKKGPEFRHKGEGKGIVSERAANFPKLIGGITEEEKKDAWKIHSSANYNCLGGAMDCMQQKITPITRTNSVRGLYYGIGDKANEYQIPDRKGEMNKSIDSWEVHELLRGEGLGTRIFDPKELKYSDKSNIPTNIDYSKITIGTLIGQGKTRDTSYTQADKGDRPRHTLVVAKFDTDGMPIVYDYGKLRRLDKPVGSIMASPKHQLTEFTIPKGYEGLTFEGIKKEMSEYSKGIKDDGTEVKFNTSKMPKNAGRNVKYIEDTINKEALNIARYYGVNESIVKELGTYLPGLSYQESKLNDAESYGKATFADNAFGNTMGGKGIIKSLGNGVARISNLLKVGKGFQRPDYKVEIENHKAEGSISDLRKKLEEEKKLKKGYTEDKWTPSVGPFAIKYMPEYSLNKGIPKSELTGIDVSEENKFKRGTITAISLLTESYKELARKYPDLTKEELIELSLVSYNNQGKVNDPEFRKYYIKDKVLKDDYLEKIKANRKYSMFLRGGVFRTNTDSNGKV